MTARQDEILAVAGDLLAREGVEAVTLGRIARELGIRTPSLYKHFPSKRHIEAALIARALEAVVAAVEAAGPRLADVTGAYRAFAAAQPQAYRLMTEGPLPRDLLPDGLEARAAAPLVAAAVGDRDLARAAWAFAHGMIQLEHAGRFPPDADLDRAWAAGVAAFGG